MKFYLESVFLIHRQKKILHLLFQLYLTNHKGKKDKRLYFVYTPEIIKRIFIDDSSDVSEIFCLLDIPKPLVHCNVYGDTPEVFYDITCLCNRMDQLRNGKSTLLFIFAVCACS